MSAQWTQAEVYDKVHIRGVGDFVRKWVVQTRLDAVEIALAKADESAFCVFADIIAATHCATFIAYCSPDCSQDCSSRRRAASTDSTPGVVNMILTH